MDTILAMRAFAAVARTRSFTRGAEDIGLSTQVVSKYVQQLESHLDAQLLNRTTRKVTLTDTGRAYLDRCVPLLAEFDELESLVQERRAVLAGPIRLTAPTAFGSAELVKALASFQVVHPKVEIDLHLADHRLNIVEEGFDLAIRFGRLEDSTLMARPLIQMPMIAYASPDYLSAHGRPQHPDDLASHNCLLQRTSAEHGQWAFLSPNGLISVRVDGSFRANSPRAIAHMAAGGIGIGMTPQYVAEPFMASGLLEQVLPGYELAPFSLWAVYPQTRHLVARVRALIDHLSQTLQTPTA